MDDGQISLTRPDGTALTLHHGTPYRVTSFEPFTRGVRADSGGDAPWSDGGWSGAEWRATATVPLEISVHTASWTELMAAWWALDAAFAPVRTGGECELRWAAAGTEYLMYARPRGATLTNRRARTGYAKVTASVYCPDPAIYSGIEHAVEEGLYRRIGGLALPAPAPWVLYTTPADGEADIVNAGAGQARLDLHIDGPVAGPRVSLRTPAGVETLSLDTVLEADEYLDVDTKDRTVVLNGATTRLADQSGAWPLLSGTATVRFDADDYHADARLTVRWRDTW